MRRHELGRLVGGSGVNLGGGQPPDEDGAAGRAERRELAQQRTELRVVGHVVGHVAGRVVGHVVKALAAGRRAAGGGSRSVGLWVMSDGIRQE